MAVVSAMQHGMGLLLLDTGTTERKGEFVTATHGQERVKQTNGWKNVHSGDAKIRLQGLLDGLSDDLRMADGVGAVLVYPRVKGGDIHVAYFLTFPSHGMQSHRTCPSTKKRPSRGSRGFTRSNERGNWETAGSLSTRRSHWHSHISMTV